MDQNGQQVPNSHDLHQEPIAKDSDPPSEIICFMSLQAIRTSTSCDFG
jgi:hypothetical protein